MNIFLFHRDLRFHDNLALEALLEKSSEICFVFIFNKNQTDPKKNDYFSPKAFKFMKKRLWALNQKYHINFFEANSEIEVFEALQKQQSISRIYTNKDFTPFAKKRDLELKAFCEREDIEYNSSFNDYLLFNPGDIVSKDKNYFKTFNPFYQMCLAKYKDVPQPKVKKRKIITKKIQSPFSFDLKEQDFSTDLPFLAPNVFAEIKKIKDYNSSRNFLDIENSTSKISAAIKFGVISSRELFWFCVNYFNKLDNSFLRQVLWREFNYHHYILASQKGEYIFGNNIQRKFDSFPWIKDENDSNCQKWKSAQTGVSIVDAAMNQLHQTGFMHNRARLIVASYLTKDLNIHWKLGEKHFANHLIDYDPIVNQESWQWVAGPGLDFRNAYRLFAAEIQAEKFDPKGIYRNKYLPRDYEEQNIDLKQLRKKFRERWNVWSLHNESK